MSGICSYGGYVPRYRLNRGLVFAAMGWMNPANMANARGEKAVASFDEDSITMAVAAGIDSLKGFDRSKVEGVYFASTSMPYKERLNSGIIAGALGLNDHVRAADFAGGIKAGTTALLAALEGVESKRTDNLLVCASDCRLGRPATSQEMIFGDAAAAFLVGNDDVIAEFKGSYSITYDFVDHFSIEGAKYDRQWEDRWIRDRGFTQFIPEVINGLLNKYQLKLSDFAKVIYPCHYSGARKMVNKKLGIAPEADQNNFQNEIGETGTPHSLLMLVNALEQAKPGDKVMVVSFGSGCDALYFEVTDNIEKKRDRNAISGSLANRAELDNYTKYLVWRDILPADAGMRAEEDIWTRWSAFWRERKLVLGFRGGKCKECGTAQIPLQRVCVNPYCEAIDAMEDYCFADKTGRIISYTGDNLAASLDPPSIYGSVEFDGGGKFELNFADCDVESLSPGMAVYMTFRKKYYDARRGIITYFWKAIPVKEVK